MRYLGIDYGKKKIGLALSEGQLATPFQVLDVSSLKDAINKISQVIKSEEIDRVVVGVPDSGEAKSIVKKFITELEKVQQKIEIIGVDETLSSYDAKAMMLELNLSQRQRQKEDAYSAVIILQNFLNSLS